MILFNDTHSFNSYVRAFKSMSNVMVRFDMEYTPWGCGFTHTGSPAWGSWGNFGRWKPSGGRIALEVSFEVG